MKAYKKALVVGSSGLVGNFLLKILLFDIHYNEVEIWSRTPSEISHLKLKEKIVDYDAMAEMEVTPFDDVYCCLGTTIRKAKSKEAFRKVDFDYVVELAKYSVKAGASKFIVVSSLGANIKSSNFYLRTKGEMEEAVKALAIPGIYIVRPSLLLGKRNDFRFGEYLAKKFMKFFGRFMIGKLKKYKGIHAKAVAKAMHFQSRRENPEIITIDANEILKIGNT